MDNELKKLEILIQEKVDEGLFPSVEKAVESICEWLNSVERHYIDEEMRNEDA